MWKFGKRLKFQGKSIIVKKFKRGKEQWYSSRTFITILSDRFKRLSNYIIIEVYTSI